MEPTTLVSMPDVLQSLGIAIAATTGLVQVLKEAGLPSRWAPLTSLFVGVLAVFIFSDGVFTFPMVGMGLIVGLSASGLFAGVKTTAQKEVRATVALEDVKMTAPKDTDVKLEG